MRNVGPTTNTFSLFGYWKTGSTPSTAGGSPDYYGSFSATLAPGATYTLAAVDISGWSTTRYYKFTWNGAPCNMSPSSGEFLMNSAMPEYQYLDLWCGTLPWYIVGRIINDTSYSSRIGVVIQTTPAVDVAGGEIVMQAGEVRNMCLGPFTNRVDWYVWNQSSVWRPDDTGNGYTLEQGSNLAFYATVPVGWNNGCTNAVDVLLSQTVVASGTNSIPGSSGINWTNVAGNTNIMNGVDTNLSASVAAQIGANALLDMLSKIEQNTRSSSGGGGGTTVVTNNVEFGQITNQLNSATNLLHSVTGQLAWGSMLASNTWWSATNSGAWSNAMGGTGLSNGLWGTALSSSNSARAGSMELMSQGDFSTPTVGTDTPSDEFSFKGIGGYTLPLVLPWEGGSTGSDSNITWIDWGFSTMRAFLAIVLVVGLWARILKEGSDSMKYLMQVNQVRVMKAQVLGTSLGLPVSIALALALIAALLALPAALVVYMETTVVSSVGTVSSAVSSLSSVGTAQGIWGLVKTFAPWQTGVAVIVCYVAWVAFKETLTHGLAALKHGFIAD